ncbi:hypothetical protein GGI12_004759 [Dipsacomyces acuminosporus]|nr:hypothetical protein GGI12_004759 [Dipsacomyces acuminosporus]
MEQDGVFEDILSGDLRDEADIIQSAELTDDKKRGLLSLRFSRIASSGDAQALERLWDKCHGAKWIDVDYRDDEGSTPLICAACFGHAQVIELLLAYGADINSQDKSGWTALMWATTSHNEDLVRVLLDHGASSAAKTARGHTAINIASSNLSGSDSESHKRRSDDEASDEREKGETQPFDWDTLQLDQMYVISAATVPQFLHSVVKDIRPERWIQGSVLPEHKFIPASMVFLAARFAHHLVTPDFLESFLADTIAAIIHEVQSHKADPLTLAFWMSNIQTLIYFFKRDAALVQATSEAQGRLSECMHDAYSLFIKAAQAELEPLIDVSMLAYDSMPDLFADVKFEAEKSQRLSMFFFGGQAESTRKSSDGRPLRRSQTVLQKGSRGKRKNSILSAVRPNIDSANAGLSGNMQPATASGDVPAWVVSVERAKFLASAAADGASAAALDMRPASGDTFVSGGRVSHDNQRPSQATVELFSQPSPRTITYMLDCTLDLFDMCELHPFIVRGIMRQIFCYLGSEMFNRVLTTRDFCARSRAMQIRMNATQINDWIRRNSARLLVPQTASQKAKRNSANSAASVGDGVNTSPSSPEAKASSYSPESVLYDAYFKPLVELVQLLQCLTHLPDLSEYLETTSSMLTLNILQQETVMSNYRYEVQEARIAPDVVEYLQSTAASVRDRQREKISMDRASRRSTASTMSERKTMDGRPNFLSFDSTPSMPRNAGGLVRFSVEPAANGGFGSDSGMLTERLQRPPSRLSAESSRVAYLPSSQPLSASGPAATLLPINSHNGPAGAVSSARQRAGNKTQRRSMLLPIARPTGTAGGARPSVRTLFNGPVPATASSALPPYPASASASTTIPIVGRQRAHTTVDTTDASSDDAGSIVLSGRLSGEIDSLNRDYSLNRVMSTSRMDDVINPAAVATTPPPPPPPPTTATATAAPFSTLEDAYSNPDFLTSSLRGPKGKICRAEDMNELLDSTELLPFAVPTSNEWISWWKSRAAANAQSRSNQQNSHSRDWSNETVTFHQQSKDTAASAGKLAENGTRLRAELVPVVPPEFLSVLDQIA